VHPPDELMVEQLLPSMRHLVSRRLSSEGFSQGRISSMLGVTQASVSHYLSTSPAKAYSSLSGLSLGREDADRFSSLIAEDLKRNPLDAVETLISLWIGLLARGSVCPAHRRAHPSLAQCDVCMRQFGPSRNSSEAVSQVARAVRLVEASSNFVLVMPEISVNIASLEGDSDSVDDVVAVPGRIVRVRNSARAMSPPEYGASKHMARVLLLVRRRMPEYRATLNLKYDRRIAGVLKRLGLRTMNLGGYGAAGSEDPAVNALNARLLESNEEFDALVDQGGRGIEPSLYLFGRSAPEVASTAVRIADLYSAR